MGFVVDVSTGYKGILNAEMWKREVRRGSAEGGVFSKGFRNLKRVEAF